MVRNEYPRPQFVRDEWMILNGEWEFEYDDNQIGESEKWYRDDCNHIFGLKINVPFCYESMLSGIADTKVHDVVWYKRKFQLPDSYKGKHIILHFGAVDYMASIWVNGTLVTKHEGGHVPFSTNITNALQDGDNSIVVRAEDFAKDISLPRGKQYWKDKSETIFYTRTTGIWQTVWLEPVSKIYLNRIMLTPDIELNTVTLRTILTGNVSNTEDLKLRVKISFKAQIVTEESYQIIKNTDIKIISLQDFNYHDSRWNRWWTPEHPHLYDMELTLLAGDKVLDYVKSYFGMRKISIEKGKLCLNNHPYFMKLVLDQGYFPDGLLTAPSDDALRNDVEMTKAMGFNGVRKHQKVEDPRFLYWCDKLGLLVWGEAANAYEMNEDYINRFTAEWQEAIKRDYNHPSIVAWVPLNESWGVPNILHNSKEQHHAMAMYHLIKSIDTSRLVISNDGWEHMKSDLLTIHDYEWKEDVLRERYSTEEKVLESRPAERQLHVGDTQYDDEPVIVSEFGGIAYKKSEWEGWGYSGADTDEDFLRRIQAVVKPLLQSTIVQGFCYTQLTDVEQEINGLLTYDRAPKVPLSKIKAILDGNEVC